jgi:hypothetical protein
MKENGKKLRDKKNEMIVYKIEKKKFEESDVGYISIN